MALVQKPAFLTNSQMEEIHQATLHILENKGVVIDSEEILELFKKNGAKIDGKKVMIPSTLVARLLKLVPSTFKLSAINDMNSIIVGEGLAIHPAGGEPFMRKGKDEARGEATIQDFADIQKLYQHCDNVHMAGYQPLDPIDVPNRIKSHMCAYNTMLYTDKPWLAPMVFEGKKEKTEILNMYEIAFGKEFLNNNYVTWNVISPESPLVFVDKTCEAMLEFSRYNQPTCIVSAPMSGITSPIHNLGTILLQNAETIAGICILQLINPTIPVLPSASLTYGNMRYATWECACPDTSLMLGGAIQMYREFYKIPARAQTGVTSSKFTDYQAGYEGMQSLLLTAMMDVNVTSQSVGTLENLMATSFEKTLIDNELISRVKHIISGLQTSDLHLGLDIIMDVEHGKDFLMHDSTLEYLRSGWQPSMSDWSVYDPHQHTNCNALVQNASEKVQEIISSATTLLDNSTKDRLKKYIDELA